MEVSKIGFALLAICAVMVVVMVVVIGFGSAT